MAVASLQPGHEALIQYDDGLANSVWHVRLLVSHLQEEWWIVCTPDYDLFGEQLSLANTDLAAVRFRSDRNSVPLGVAGGRIYGFTTYPTDAEWQQMLFDGQALAPGERTRLGLPMPAPIVPPAGGGGALVAAPGGPAGPLAGGAPALGGAGGANLPAAGAQAQPAAGAAASLPRAAQRHWQGGQGPRPRPP